MFCLLHRQYGASLVLLGLLVLLLEGCGGEPDRVVRESVVVRAPDGSSMLVTRRTYFSGGRVVASVGEVLKGRDGSLSIRNTYDLQYETPKRDAQVKSYQTQTLEVSTGRILCSKRHDIKYWTKNDDRSVGGAESAGPEMRGYSEERTVYYRPVGRPLFPVASASERGFDRDYLLSRGFEEGVTSKTTRSDMRYYTKEDELANVHHLSGQLASYSEVRTYSSTPDLVIEVEWYGAEYDWAFKHEDDQELVYRPQSSTEYIDGFVLTPTEVYDGDSVSFITGYSERGEDNLGHVNAREWRSSIDGYDRFGRLVEYSEEGQSDEGVYSYKRSSIDYDHGEVTSYSETGTDSGGEEYTYERTDIAYDWMNRETGYTERGNRNGLAYSRQRSDMVYNDAGQLNSYLEVGASSGVITTRKRASTLYDGYGRIAYFDEVVLNERTDNSANDHGSEELVRLYDGLQRPLEILTYAYRLSEHGTRTYYEGAIEFREYDLHGDVRESRTVEFRMTPAEPGADLSDPESYDREFTGMEVTRSSGHDVHGHPGLVEVEEYRHVAPGDDELEQIGGKTIENREFDSKGRATKSQTCSYLIDDDGGRNYIASTKVTSVFEDDGTAKISTTWMRIEGEPDDDCGSDGRGNGGGEAADAGSQLRRSGHLLGTVPRLDGASRKDDEERGRQDGLRRGGELRRLRHAGQPGLRGLAVRASVPHRDESLLRRSRGIRAGPATAGDDDRHLRGR